MAPLISAQIVICKLCMLLNHFYLPGGSTVLGTGCSCKLYMLLNHSYSPDGTTDRGGTDCNCTLCMLLSQVCEMAAIFSAQIVIVSYACY